MLIAAVVWCRRQTHGEFRPKDTTAINWAVIVYYSLRVTEPVKFTEQQCYMIAHFRAENTNSAAALITDGSVSIRWRGRPARVMLP